MPGVAPGGMAPYLAASEQEGAPAGCRRRGVIQRTGVPPQPTAARAFPAHAATALGAFYWYWIRREPQPLPSRLPFNARVPGKADFPAAVEETVPAGGKAEQRTAGDDSIPRPHNMAGRGFGSG